MPIQDLRHYAIKYLKFCQTILQGAQDKYENTILYDIVRLWTDIDSE